MTDINELAQRMKAAALKAIADEGPTWFSKDQLSHPEGIALHEADVEFIALASHENVLALVERLEAKEEQRANWFHMAEKLGNELDIAEKRIAELERMESTLRPVGVMSQKAYCRLENRESRFIALWPRPEIYLPRKRPDDGVIVFARTAAGVAVEGE